MSMFLILFLVSMLVSSIGFKKFVYFIRIWLFCSGHGSCFTFNKFISPNDCFNIIMYFVDDLWLSFRELS